MRLLLDEMYDRAIAEQLRVRGHDVVAVTERPLLRGLDDAMLLREAASEQRAILTENAAHFFPVFEEAIAVGEETFGLLFTSPRSMPRSRATIGLFVVTLESFLTSHTDEDALRDGVAWLAPV